MYVDPELADLGVRLADTAIRNTAGAIANKIKTVKAKKDDKVTIQELEEIVNSLIDDKNELLQIAQAYKQDLVAQQISQEDIEYITDEFIPILKDLIKQTSSNENNSTPTDMEKALDSLTPLLSVEMLTVLQLVGFNFKKAIGEPLTILLHKFIMSKVPVDPQSNLEYNKMAAMLSTEVLKVVQDKDASDRLARLKSEGLL